MSLPIIPRVALRISSPNGIPSRTRAIASPCRHLIARTPHHHARDFTTSPSLYKKAGKANKAHARTDSSPPVNPARAGLPTATDYAFDLSNLESQILKAIEKLTHDLSQLRSGGRLNPEVVESLKVQLGIAGKEGTGKETVRLGDIAQVVPRGRVINVICGEAEHIKPISSAIASSPHSLTPLSPESSNPLTIQVPLPPPTGESRRAAIDAAGKAAAEADKWIQSARQTHNKSLRKKSLDKSVLPDDLQKASKAMEEVVKKGHAEVKRIVEGAKKVLESQ
ncbi:ribosome recycling factor [Byssothecium circinans]|uniref:Ribosome recycling factor n=1 Tax=Byssothecium circinans TaxID=147558 RepID=A0A6A5TI67_9PLEO|nr:ribosome recycling factor [Byssothecium circinans]